MKNISFHLAIAFTIVALSCTKEPNQNGPSNQVTPFHSDELSTIVDGASNLNNMANSLKGTPYNHFIEMNMSQEFRFPDNMINKRLFFTTIDIEGFKGLLLANTQFTSINKFINYVFSNDGILVAIDGEPTDFLLEKDFEKIKYELELDSKYYSGTFAHPGDFKSNDIPIGISISRSEDLALSWAIPKYGGGDVKIELRALAVPGGESIAPINLTVDDIGSFSVPQSIIATFPVGTTVSTKLVRQIFTAEDDLLIRSTMYRNWISLVKD